MPDPDTQSQTSSPEDEGTAYESTRREVFEVVARHSTEGIFATDAVGNVTLWNPAIARLTRVAEQEALGARLSDCLRLGVDEDAVLQRALAGEPIDKVRVTVEREGGHPMSAVLSAGPLARANGRTSGIGGLLRDITEEVELQAFLQEMEQLMAMIQRQAVIGVWAWDIESDEMQWSEQLYEIIGVSPLDFEASLESCLARVDESHRDEVQRAMRTSAVEGTPFSVEFPITRPDQSIVWVYMSGDAVRDARGRIASLRGVCQDLTERQQAIEALQRADRLKDEFLGIVSHELKTPITVLMGMSKVLQMRAPDELHEHLEVIARNASEMNLMVERILDYSRIEGGRVRIEPSDQRMDELIADVLPLVQAKLEEHEFVVDIEEGLVVHVDPKAFPRILVNLLTNAAKYAPKGSRIDLRAHEQGDVARIEVEDRGQGIPADQVEDIFERFYQVRGDDVARKKGAGLGLSIVRSYVEGMGGRVWAESAVGEGSTFKVEVPLAKGQP